MKLGLSDSAGEKRDLGPYAAQMKKRGEKGDAGKFRDEWRNKANEEKNRKDKKIEWQCVEANGWAEGIDGSVRGMEW